MNPAKYLALGDSYTIGEAVELHENFPHVLTKMLSTEDAPIDPPTIIATTGWTTDELIKGIEERNIDGQVYDLVSLLIGVNNQYRGYPIEQYRTEFEQLLKKAIEFGGYKPHNVFVVSIPDWGRTPFADGKDRAIISKEINQYNEIARNICHHHRIMYVDITEISRVRDPEGKMITTDKLHPSAFQYDLWARKIVKDLF